MGKNGALNAWLREFCSLVFTQTLQAFIYAIIITLVMTGLNWTNSNEYMETELINKTSIGIINIFALTSIFKIEEMARRIFGLQRSGFQSESPMQSMAKLAFISRFGRRLWDNGKKIVRGGFGMGKSVMTKRKDRRKHLKQDIKRGESIATLQDKIKTMEENGQQGAQNEGTSTVISNQSATSGTSDRTLDVATLNINATNVNMSGGGAQSDEEKLEKMKDRLDSLLEARDAARDAYDDKVSASNKQFEDSLHMMLSGVSETVGATLGGALGAVVGGADGKNVSQGVVVGMNLGDRVGQGAVDLGFSANDIVKNIKKDIKVRGELGDLDSDAAGIDELVEAIKEQRKLEQVNIRNLTSEIKKATAKKKATLSTDTDSVIDNM